MSGQQLELIAWMTPLFALIGTLVYAFRNRKERQKHSWLPVYLLGALSFDLFTRYFAGYLSNNLFLVPLYGIFELLIFTWWFRSQTSSRLYQRMQLFTLALIIYLGYETAMIVRLPAEQFQSFGRCMTSLTIVSYCIMAMLRSVKQAEQEKPANLFMSSITLVYFLISSTWYLTVNFFVNQPTPSVFNLWLVFALSTPLFYFMLPLALHKHGKSPR